MRVVVRSCAVRALLESWIKATVGKSEGLPAVAVKAVRISGQRDVYRNRLGVRLGHVYG